MFSEEKGKKQREQRQTEMKSFRHLEDHQGLLILRKLPYNAKSAWENMKETRNGLQDCLLHGFQGTW